MKVNEDALNSKIDAASPQQIRFALSTMVDEFIDNGFHEDLEIDGADVIDAMIPVYKHVATSVLRRGAKTNIADLGFDATYIDDVLDDVVSALHQIRDDIFDPEDVAAEDALKHGMKCLFTARIALHPDVRHLKGALTDVMLSLTALGFNTKDGLNAGDTTDRVGILYERVAKEWLSLPPPIGPENPSNAGFNLLSQCCDYLIRLRDDGVDAPDGSEPELGELLDRVNEYVTTESQADEPSRAERPTA
jgi:hypothetical protein